MRCHDDARPARRSHGKPMRKVAALYVETGGVYFGLPDVDPWGKSRDAKQYRGPWPVVAHPPCARWSMLAAVNEARYGIPRGQDGGCFAAALHAVRKFGGVLEHPAESGAWRWFGLNRPPTCGGWVNADWLGGWTCCVAQRNYGHRARKRTWLYAVGVRLPSLRWGDGPLAGEIRTIERMGKRERLVTPEPFRNLLLSMARSVGG